MRPSTIATMLAVLSLAVLGVACAGSPPPATTRYLLPISEPNGIVRISPAVLVGLGSVKVAPYLAQPGIVVETAPGQIRVANQHVWAEPIERGLSQFLRSEITGALGYEISDDATSRGLWDYAIDVSIDRLHGTSSGSAVLVAYWTVTPRSEDESSAAYRFASREALAAPGYAALLDTEMSLTRALAVAIAGTVPVVISSRETEVSH